MGNNILIVDDAAFMRMMVKDILVTKGGYNVVGEAENGVVAVQKYHRVKAGFGIRLISQCQRWMVFRH